MRRIVRTVGEDVDDEWLGELIRTHVVSRDQLKHVDRVRAAMRGRCEYTRQLVERRDVAVHTTVDEVHIAGDPHGSVRLDAYRDCLLELLPARHAAHVWIGDVAHGARVVRDDHSVVLGESGQEPGRIRMGDMGLTWPHGVDALLIIISCVDKLIQFRVHLRSEFGID